MALGGTAERAVLTATARWRALAGAAASAWGRTLATALGVGALAGAGQLGIGYGLGLLHYPVPASAVAGPGIGGPALTSGVWASQLTWLAWFAALAVLAGAAGGNWMARRWYGGLAPVGRAAAAVAAGIGRWRPCPLDRPTWSVVRGRPSRRWTRCSPPGWAWWSGSSRRSRR
jgi:hypothetical protein